ncbi:MAG: hypothetical protein ABJB66_09870 [Gemmatimonadaceae bacterium]
MTLMEAVVALVILSLVAIGCLELSQEASQLELSATQWNRAVTLAESRMSQYTSGAPTDVPNSSDVQLSRVAWRNGFDVVTVSVLVGSGKRYELHRVLPSVRPNVASAAR